jgi:hypothetical protein
LGELKADDKKTHLEYYREYSNFFWIRNFRCNEFSLVEFDNAKRRKIGFKC